MPRRKQQAPKRAADSVKFANLGRYHSLGTIGYCCQKADNNNTGVRVTGNPAGPGHPHKCTSNVTRSTSCYIGLPFCLDVYLSPSLSVSLALSLTDASFLRRVAYPWLVSPGAHSSLKCNRGHTQIIAFAKGLDFNSEWPAQAGAAAAARRWSCKDAEYTDLTTQLFFASLESRDERFSSSSGSRAVGLLRVATTPLDEK
ncbi:hypothetical protein EYF80_024564 [Liparis tanakae]|uniref:Uncharacterized protein n=1 Tax=Liparis tanakae TaxID=230148 RepID=A0A4Z2HJ47_9TELE|nr:hypothetical protein EYF80_024564 [Liparis tanakae]